MEFWTSKESEILDRMHEVLESRGYVKVDDRERSERWAHPVSDVIVELGYTASTHDPIYAWVSRRPDDNCKAWNSKGLLIHLELAEAVASRDQERKLSVRPTRREIE